MIRTMIMTDLAKVLLKIVAKLQPLAYGRSITARAKLYGPPFKTTVEERRDSTVYLSLQKLEASGFIISWEETQPKRKLGRARRIYFLTAKGKKALLAEKGKEVLKNLD